MWDQEHLQETIKQKMEGYTLIIASNRQPYHHTVQNGKVICRREPGGLVTALNPVMEVLHGTWIAVGSGEFDRRAVDTNGKVAVPPEQPSFSLKRLFLSKEDQDGYYYGFSNEGLWPLCHVAYTRPYFHDSDWQSYERVNRQFADAILEEVGEKKAFVWIHDFHLALAAKFLREANRPNIITSVFWHIPWPNPEVFRICPRRKELIEGLLASDLIGFQIRYHADNFFASVDRELESRIDRENMSIFYQGRETLVRPFPISIDFERISKQAESKAVEEAMARMKEEYRLEGKKIILGVDRIDYTKGIPERMRALDRFLEKYPENKGNVVFFQLGQISRIHLPRYKQLNDEINAVVEEINWKHSQGDWSPIFLTRKYVNYDEILVLYRMADMCVVSSLHDGMNLVAKEYVAARSDSEGVLLLSNFTGSSRELTDALLINPYDPETFADSIQQALEMSGEERSRRMKKMREVVANQNIYRWAGKILSQLLKFEFQEV